MQVSIIILYGTNFQSNIIVITAGKLSFIDFDPFGRNVSRSQQPVGYKIDQQ